jgi:hypothetical protein
VLKSYQVALILSTVSVFMAICAGGIVPSDSVTGAAGYIDWRAVAKLSTTMPGVVIVLGSWVLFFLLIYNLDKTRPESAGGEAMIEVGGRLHRAESKAVEVLDVLDKYPTRKDKEIIMRNCLSAFAQNEQLLSDGKDGFDYPVDPKDWE